MISVALTTADLDSRRFGIAVERGRFGENVPSNAILEAVQASTADLIIMRLPAGMTDAPVALQARGEKIIHADTLVYYGVDLGIGVGSPFPAVRPATDADREAIGAIAATSFGTYRSHYSANPLIPQERVLEGYIEWAQSRLNAARSGEATWVATERDVVVGFVTCDILDDTVEIVLNAVHPEFEGRGHYASLLSHLQHHYGEHGLRRMIISTQIWNYRVQRQWVRRGFCLSQAWDTYHVDRRLAGTSGGA